MIVLVVGDQLIEKIEYVADIATFNALPKYNVTSFVSVWDTRLNSTGSSATNQVKLPIYSGGTYNFEVFWGDGSSDVITAWNDAEVTHTYSAEGVYTIEINGIIDGFRFNNVEDKLKITDIIQWGNLRIGNSGSTFYGCSILGSITATDVLNTTGVTIMANMFSGASSFTGDISLWDVSSVTSMNNMFFGASSFSSDLSRWKVSSVNSMYSMFKNLRTDITKHMYMWVHCSPRGFAHPILSGANLAFG